MNKDFWLFTSPIYKSLYAGKHRIPILHTYTMFRIFDIRTAKHNVSIAIGSRKDSHAHIRPCASINDGK